jgi:hypothetical protein
MSFSACEVTQPESCWVSIDNLFFKVMKLTAVMILACSLHLSARSYSQTYSLRFKDEPLEKALHTIQKVTGYSFIYFMEDVQNYKVSFEVRDVSIEQVLRTCLNGIPLEFTIEGKIVSLKKVLPPVADFKGKSDVNVTGRIQNDGGEPLSGASVTVVGSKKGIITNARGEFTLDNVPSDAVLEVSYIGYQNKKISIAGKSSLVVTLSAATGMLDQVEVIAYGETTQRFSTGDINTVTSKEIEAQPVTDPMLALEGRVPGLYCANIGAK